MKGRIEKYAGSTCEGWLFDPERPEEPVEFRLQIDGQLQEPIFAADKFRPDLLAAGFGTGTCAFVVDMAELSNDGEPHGLTFYSVDGIVPLGFEAQWHPFDGRLEIIDSERIGGWAVNATRPAPPIEIDVYCSDIKIATITADRLRDDLKRASVGTGQHGFEIPLDGLVMLSDGVTLRITFGGSEVDVPGSPVIWRASQLESIPSLQSGTLDDVVVTGLATAITSQASIEFVPADDIGIRLYNLDALDAALAARLGTIMNQYHLARPSSTASEAIALFQALLFRLTLEQAGLWESGSLKTQGAKWSNVEHAKLCFDHRYFSRVTNSVGESLDSLWTRFKRLASAGIICRPNHLFDEFLYVRRYINVYAQIASGNYSCGLDHYISEGLFQDLSPSAWFEPHWYRHSQPGLEVGFTGVPGIIHYLLKGSSDGLSPAHHFNSDWYTEKYIHAINEASAQGRKLSPLSHYLMHGAKAKFSPLALIDEGWILKNEPRAAGAISWGWIRSGAEWELLFDRGFLSAIKRDAALRALLGRNEQLLGELSKVNREKTDALEALQVARLAVRAFLARKPINHPDEVVPITEKEDSVSLPAPQSNTSMGEHLWRRVARQG